MDEFIKKLIERLEEIEEHCLDMHNCQGQSAIVEAKEIVNELAEEYKDKSSIIDDLKAFLKEKFKYNSEQAEIWRDGSDNDAYFRQQKDLYMDRANIYGEVMREIDRLSEEYKLFGNSEQVKGGWIACSEGLPKEDERVLCLHSDDFIDCGVVIGKTWCCDMDEYSVIEGDVYAWMPLPVPYRPDKQQDSTKVAWKQQTMSRFERVE